LVTEDKFPTYANELYLCRGNLELLTVWKEKQLKEKGVNFLIELYKIFHIRTVSSDYSEENIIKSSELLEKIQTEREE